MAQAGIESQLRRDLVVILEKASQIVVAPTGGRHGQLVVAGLDFSQKEVGKPGGWVAGIAVVGNGAIEVQGSLRAAGRVERVELVLAKRGAKLERVRSDHLGHR